MSTSSCCYYERTLTALAVDDDDGFQKCCMLLTLYTTFPYLSLRTLHVTCYPTVSSNLLGVSFSVIHSHGTNFFPKIEIYFM